MLFSFHFLPQNFIVFFDKPLKAEAAAWWNEEPDSRINFCRHF
jgi:hypothetical protein